MTDDITKLLHWPEPPVFEPVPHLATPYYYDFGTTPHATIRVIKDRRPIADIEIERDSVGELEIRGHTGYEVINQKMLTP
jgi:hypothetical protein